jgi:hypothetical protein
MGLHVFKFVVQRIDHVMHQLLGISGDASPLTLVALGWQLHQPMTTLDCSLDWVNNSCKPRRVVQGSRGLMQDLALSCMARH